MDWDDAMRAGATDPAASVEVPATAPLYELRAPDGSTTVRDNGGHTVAAAWVASQVARGATDLGRWSTGDLTDVTGGTGHLLPVYAPLVGGFCLVLPAPDAREPAPATERWVGERLAERVIALGARRGVPEDAFLATYGLAAR